MTFTPAETAGLIARAPKALLHDHLDGGLRPQTVIELADAAGRAEALPASDAEPLGRWFRDAADSGSLERYLETFSHTVAVMQTEEQLHRVAMECALDLAEDGVVYAEVRFAPELHVEQGLPLAAVVEAVLAGFDTGMAEARERGIPIRMRALLTAMRHAATSREIAKLAVRYRDEGVAGFDIAGAEAGNPPTRHLNAFEFLQRESMHFTIHAGEAFGLPSIWEALHFCGADRLGHGVRIIDDITVDAEGAGHAARERAWSETGRLVAGEGVHLGRIAAYVRDSRIPLEMCPSSNLQTGAAASLAEHPITLLKQLRYRVTVNTDNRLMSGTSMTREMRLLVDEAGWTMDDLRWVTINALKSAFLPFDERLALIEHVVKPGYAALGA